jgi:penicillin-binding protein 1A
VLEDVGSRRRWKPVNSDDKFRGPMTLYQALVSSRNLISIKILDRLGFEPLFNTARAMGITENLPASLALALGAHGLRLPELLTAYSTFPNMGTRVTPRYITRIEDRHGRVVEIIEPERIPAVDPGAACVVTWMLRGVVAFGTGTVVKPLDRPVGGKTGTTNDFSDAWFVGFTPELVTAIWLGTDQQRARAVGEVGGVAAAPIFLYYMREVLKDRPVREFTVPPEAVIQPGGEFGICYKAGTMGRGLSEAGLSRGSAEGNFLRGDFDGQDFDPGPDEGSDGLPDLPDGEAPGPIPALD